MDKVNINWNSFGLINYTFTKVGLGLGRKRSDLNIKIENQENPSFITAKK